MDELEGILEIRSLDELKTIYDKSFLFEHSFNVLNGVKQLNRYL